MLDLETLGLNLGSGIIQIGVVFFDPDAGVDSPIESYSVSANVRQDGNTVVDPATVDWWKDTDEPLYHELMERSERAMSISDAIGELRALFERHAPQCVWAKRPAFDIAQLNLRMQELGIEPFWKFYKVFDCATVTETILRLTGIKPVMSRDSALRAHDGEADAVHQVRLLQQCLATPIHAISHNQSADRLIAAR
ncbi:MAG: 3'-5' exonuclease [Pseudomonas sp.]